MKFKRRFSAINDNVPLPKETMEQYNFQSLDQINIPTQSKSVISYTPTQIKPGQMFWEPALKKASIAKKQDTLENSKAKKNYKSTSIPTLCLGLFFASLFGLFGALLSEATHSQISVIAGFGALCAASGLAFKEFSWRLREMLSISLLCFLSVAGVMLTGQNLPSLMIPISGLALIISFVSVTRLPALISLVGLLGLAYLASPFEIAPLQLNNSQGAFLTAILIFFIGLGTRLKSRSVFYTAILCVSAWAGIWLHNSGINYAGIAAFIFIVSAAQYKLGKAGFDAHAFGSMPFLVIGWIASFTAFLVLQWGLLSGEAYTLMSIGKRPMTSISWIIGCASAVACIFVAGLSRHSHARQSWFSVFTSTVSLAVVPFIAFRPDILSGWLIKLAGPISFIPSIGLIFAACGLSASTIMTINGLRLGRQLYISLGLIALGAQIMLLMQPELLTFENGIVFLSALVFAGAIGFMTRPLQAD